jgi:hypothetical protein
MPALTNVRSQPIPELWVDGPATFTSLFDIRPGRSTNPAFQVDLAGNVVIGGAALATNATDGFLRVPAMAGVASGTPTAFTGSVAVCYDTTGNKWQVYNAAWKVSAALT